MKPRLKTPQQLQAQVEEWNARYPIGTRVKFTDGRIFHTSTKAQVLSGHTAVVWVEERSGCYALDALEPEGPVQ
jgi:hypothetical protein